MINLPRPAALLAAGALQDSPEVEAELRTLCAARAAGGQHPQAGPLPAAMPAASGAAATLAMQAQRQLSLAPATAVASSLRITAAEWPGVAPDNLPQALAPHLATPPRAQPTLQACDGKAACMCYVLLGTTWCDPCSSPTSPRPPPMPRLLRPCLLCYRTPFTTCHLTAAPACTAPTA